MRAAAPARRSTTNPTELLPLPLVRMRIPLNRAPGEACSRRTRARSASSSSASRAIKLVRTPWPISERVIQSVTMLSGEIWINALGWNGAVELAAVELSGNQNASANAEPDCRNVRRLMLASRVVRRVESRGAFVHRCRSGTPMRTSQRQFRPPLGLGFCEEARRRS